MTRLRAGRSGVRIPEETFLSSKKSSLPFKVYCGYFPRIKRSERGADSSKLVHRLRISGVIPVLHLVFVYRIDRDYCISVIRSG